MRSVFTAVGATSLIVVCVVFAGCAICCGPEDYTYPTFGGKYQRMDPHFGRVGSIYSDPGVGMVSGGHEMLWSEELPPGEFYDEYYFQESPSDRPRQQFESVPRSPTPQDDEVFHYRDPRMMSPHEAARKSDGQWRPVRR